MTRRTNARIAGAAFILYIALGIPAIVLLRATQVRDPAARLAAVAAHATEVRAAAVLILCTAFTALVLGVTLYAITRDEDPDVALLALTFRVAEGVVAGLGVARPLQLLWIATATGPSAPDTEAALVAAAVLTAPGGAVGFFAVASTLFSWLMLRGRLIPTALAWFGLIVSLLWVLAIPFQIAGTLRPGLAQIILWIPMAAFEILLGLWLIIKGVNRVALPASRGAGAVIPVQK
jgi:hypothetical protein